MAQAAAYLEETDIDPSEYLDQFSAERSALLARGEVLGYQGRLDTAWDMSLQRLAASCPEALHPARTQCLPGVRADPARDVRRLVRS